MFTGVHGAEGIFSFKSFGSLICARTIGKRAAAPVRDALRVFRPWELGREIGAVRLFSSVFTMPGAGFIAAWSINLTS